MKTPQEWLEEFEFHAQAGRAPRPISEEMITTIQADARADLLERLAALRKLVEDIDDSDLLRHHPMYCAIFSQPKECTCEVDALQLRINEALKP